MLILNAEEVAQALPMAECIEAMKEAYAALSSGKANAPLRTRISIPDKGLALFMPAHVDEEEGDALGLKVVSVFNENPSKGLPLIHAAVLVLNSESGEVDALLEGGSLTAIRTGAGSGAATDVLARRDAATAAIFGAGVQARTQLEAICAVRRIETVWVYAPDADGVATFIAEMRGQGQIPEDLRMAKDATEAIGGADIICAATTSSTPVFEDAGLKAGAHINGVGSYTPEMQEIPGESVGRALVSVDSRGAALAECGDLANPLKMKLISEETIHEIGEIIAGTKPGRSSESQVTFFKSVGVAAQDAVAGRLAVANARRMGFGLQVEL